MSCCYTDKQWEYLNTSFETFIKQHENNNFRLFLFGALSTSEIVKSSRLGKSPDPKSKIVYGWKRAFFGTFKNASPGEGGSATLIKDYNGCICGLEILFKVSNHRVQVLDHHGNFVDCHDGFFQLMKSEAIGYKKYKLTFIENDKTPLYAFTHDLRYHNLNFYKPTEKYAVAIAKTIDDFRMLSGKIPVQKPYIIDMRSINGNNMGYVEVSYNFKNVRYHYG